jgi:hypothetical protein
MADEKQQQEIDEYEEARKTACTVIKWILEHGILFILQCVIVFGAFLVVTISVAMPGSTCKAGDELNMCLVQTGTVRCMIIIGVAFTGWWALVFGSLMWNRHKRGQVLLPI